MRYLLIMLILACNTNSFSQDHIRYYNLVNYGEYLTYIGKYEKAIGLYEKAFALKEKPLNKDLLCYAKSLFLSGDTLKCIITLERASKHWMGYNVQYWDTSFYESLLASSYKDHVLEITESNNKLFRKTLDSVTNTIIPIIDQWCDSDQYYTRLRMYPSNNDSLLKKAMYEDKMFYERFYNYIEANGYPGFWVTGTNILATVSLHIRRGEQAERFRALYEKEYEKGNIESYEYLRFVDRVIYGSDKKCWINVYPNGYCNVAENREDICKNRIANGYTIFFKESRKWYNREMKLSELTSYFDEAFVDKLIY